MAYAVRKGLLVPKPRKGKLKLPPWSRRRLPDARLPLVWFPQIFPETMAVAPDAITSTVTNDTGGAATMTISNHTVGAALSNGAIAILVEWASATFPSGVTVVRDSITATLIPGTQFNSGGGCSGAAYAILNPSAGNKNIVVSWTGNLEAHAVAISFSGVDQTSVAVGFPHGTTNVHPTSTASPNSITITSASGNYVVAGHTQDTATWAAISDTTLATDASGPQHGVAFNYSAGAATKTLTAAWTGGGSGQWASWGFDVLAAGGGAAVVGGEPHFIGRMRAQPLVSMAALRQNQASDTSGPLGTQPETNTHFIGRFKPPTVSILQSYRQNPWFTSGPLPLQPETNTHFVGKFQPPKISVLQDYRQNPALDIPAVVITDNPPGFVGRFLAPSMRVLRGLRENTANDTSSSVTQPETNTHFVGTFASPVNRLLRSFRENQASDASSLSLQPSTNVHFIGKFVQTAINLLPALRQNTANDFSTATTQAETNTHFIGRFSQIPMTLPLLSRQNHANDFFAAAPFDNPTHFVGKFTPTMLSVLRSLRENTANDSSTPVPQADTATHFIGRFVQTSMRVSPDLRQNQATDLASAVKQIFDWLVTARRRGRR